MAGRALLAQLVEHLHGKEGVSGSSPEEGFPWRLLGLLPDGVAETVADRDPDGVLCGGDSAQVFRSAAERNRAHDLVRPRVDLRDRGAGQPDRAT